MRPPATPKASPGHHDNRSTVDSKLQKALDVAGALMAHRVTAEGTVPSPAVKERFRCFCRQPVRNRRPSGL